MPLSPEVKAALQDKGGQPLDEGWRINHKDVQVKEEWADPRREKSTPEERRRSLQTEGHDVRVLLCDWLIGCDEI
jgi:hypothetical protein